ncbi:MAG: glycoside hydrolase family 1 protein [Deltaproteobacteria bacterium]|nr:glycoside hydrolase family 1 protein [Deltaproteobacteria bacterium]
MRTFDLHFNESDARALTARLPTDALAQLQLGAACAGYQCEGGYNGPGEPHNNWGDWEGRPGVAPSGGAARFWDRFEEDVELLARHGLRTFRFSIEWARVTPVRDAAVRADPPLDPAAIARYADILAALHQRQIEPLVTLYHWTHPAHLGPDLWLDPGSPARFASYVKLMLPALLDALEKRGTPPPSRYITLNEPNMFALATYVAARFPHGAGKQGGRAARSSVENQLLAHLAAADAVREVYRARGLAAPKLTFNNNFSAFYRADLFFVDLLLAPAKGVARPELEEYLRSREARFTREFLASEGEIPVARQLLRWGVRGLEGLLRQGVTLQRLSALVDAAYRLEGRAVDYLAFDYYDPFPWNVVGRSTPGNDRGFGPVVDEWEWKPHARGLSVALELYSESAPGLPVWIAENGLATRAVGKHAFPRNDGARRDLFIKAHLYELLRARADGVPVEGYLHWSLWDNYEWGSYQPRFGLLGVDCAGGQVERTGYDAAGVPTMAAYGAIARALRSGDPSLLAVALASTELPSVDPGSRQTG